MGTKYSVYMFDFSSSIACIVLTFSKYHIQLSWRLMCLVHQNMQPFIKRLQYRDKLITITNRKDANNQYGVPSYMKANMSLATHCRIIKQAVHHRACANIKNKRIIQSMMNICILMIIILKPGPVKPLPCQTRWFIRLGGQPDQ